MNKATALSRVVRFFFATTCALIAMLIATNSSNRVSAATTPPPAPLIHIEAAPTTMLRGGYSTLTVTAKNATAVTVTGASVFTLHANGGTFKVYPTTTTIYTASATGPGGKATAKITVTVKPRLLPTITVTASPTEILRGHSSILTVTAKNATAVTLLGTNGSKRTLAATGGKVPVDPESTTTFTATASSTTQGKASAKVVVTVSPNPAPTADITASPASIKAGASSTLTVTAAHATAVKVTGSDGTGYTLKSAGGRQTVTPKSSTTYTVTATGTGGKATSSTTVKVTPNPVPAVGIVPNPATIVVGNSSTLKVTSTNATTVKVVGTDGSSYTLAATGGNQKVSPYTTTTYTATATGAGGSDSQSTTVTVIPPGSLQSIDHVIFMLQENHSFDNYFGMLNPYRTSDGKGWNVGDDGVTYNVDGLDDKLTNVVNMDDEGTSYSPFKFTSTCIDDASSDWLSSFGDVNRYNFLADRPMQMNGFVHNAEGYAKNCANQGSNCSGAYTDLTGERAMGYYDQDFLNYYYYMASQFALSDRWFSPIASKSVDNRIATFTGGTTEGLTKDPGGNDHLSQLPIPTIFHELDQANVSWKIYYTVTQGFCLDEDDCSSSAGARYPATDFSNLQDSYQYLYENTGGAGCTAPTQASSAVGDSTDSFCIDTDHIAPLSTFFTDLEDGTLPSFAFIEAGYGRNDEHPGSGQSILLGQAQVANIVNTFMASKEWADSVFFLSYDEGGGPYDHVPPVPGHSNDFTAAPAGYSDISGIAVNPDTTPPYYPCVPTGGTPTLHCDLLSTDPGANSMDAPAQQGFGAQLGFRLPNMVISPFTRRHYVSHIPMDHTAVIKFVENRFIGSEMHLTARDAAQPDLLDFFDFNNIPWASPPTPPTPVSAESLQTNPCTPANFAP